MIQKGTWIQIHKIVLTPEERPLSIPEDTKKVPLEMWVKGFLLEDALLGSVAKIRTVTGRIEQGEMVQASPAYRHSFGEYVPEISEIDRLVKPALFEGDPDD